MPVWHARSEASANVTTKTHAHQARRVHRESRAPTAKRAWMEPREMLESLELRPQWPPAKTEAVESAHKDQRVNRASRDLPDHQVRLGPREKLESLVHRARLAHPDLPDHRARLVPMVSPARRVRLVHQVRVAARDHLVQRALRAVAAHRDHLDHLARRAPMESLVNPVLPDLRDPRGQTANLARMDHRALPDLLDRMHSTAHAPNARAEHLRHEFVRPRRRPYKNSEGILGATIHTYFQWHSHSRWLGLCSVSHLW